MKKYLLCLFFVVSAIFITSCGSKTEPINEKQEEESSYVSYNINGMSFELPKEWETTVEEGKSVEVKEIGKCSMFSALKKPGLPKDDFDFYATDYIESMLKNTIGNDFKMESNTKNKHGSYDAYDFVGKTSISSLSYEIDGTSLYVKDSGVTFFLWKCNKDKEYDLDKIYSHIIKSIK